MAERRAEGVRLLQAGEMTQAQIGRYLGVNEATVSQWKRKLEERVLAAGFPTEQRTQARVKQVIEREFGVSYHWDYISRLQHDLGWSVQKPHPRAIERDEELNRA